MTYRPFPKESLPHFKAIDPLAIEPAISAQLAKNRVKVQDLLKQPGPYGWENLVQPLEDMNDEFAKLWSPIAHLHAVLESEPLRKAYNETLPQITQFHTELGQNEQLYRAVFSIVNSPDVVKLTPTQRKIIDNEIRDFKLNGVQLDDEKKLRMLQLQQQLSQLMTKFSENILDATGGWYLHISEAHELTGLPEGAIQLAREEAENRNLPGYVITLDYPSYSTALKFLKNRKLRKTLYEAYTTRASDQGPNASRWDNSQVMREILSIRKEMAEMVGYKNFAEYSLATKMAKTPEHVLEFLMGLLKQSQPVALKDYAEVNEFAKEVDQIEQVQAWDLLYYAEKYSQSHFKISQEDLRPYFPIENVLKGMFSIVEKLYGLKILPESDVEVWQDSVRFFSIYDADGELRGGLYTDLYARAHKRDGAWMDECLSRHFEGKCHQVPVAYLNCNFMPPLKDQQGLLTHDDVLTLFHEFGHCLHHILTKINLPAVAGINGVPWDAVEFPSQFMENFCWEKESLKLLSSHYKTGEKIPDELYEKLRAAKNFQSGLQMLRQLEFALFDFRLHLEFDKNNPNQIQDLLNEIRQETFVLPIPPFNRFQHSFSHIFAGGYAAGYYSYKWAEVLSSDAYSKFQENGIFDRATGNSFLKNILEVGGVGDIMQHYIDFRGRPPDIEALLKQNGINE